MLTFADYQEDRSRTIPDFNAMIPEETECDRSVRRCLFGVFDGHGGDQVREGALLSGGPLRVQLRYARLVAGVRWFILSGPDRVTVRTNTFPVCSFVC